MSAVIGNNVQMKEILKATEYDCPTDLEGKTFNEATSGSDCGKLITLDIKAVPVEDTNTHGIKHYNVVVDFSKYPDKYIQLPFNNTYLYPIEHYERVLSNSYLDKDGNVVGNGYDVYNEDGQIASFTYLPSDKSVTKIIVYIDNHSDKSLKLFEINVSYPE